MPSSRSRRTKTDRYSSNTEKEFMFHRGQKVPLGGVAELLRHIDFHWFAYLEKLDVNPDLPNPFEHVSDREIRKGLKHRGYISISRQQLWAKRDEYITRLENGERPYSSNLIGAYWIESPNKEQIIISFTQ